MKKVFSIAAIAALAAALSIAPGRASQTTTSPLEEQVRHELVTLPFYSLFDDLNYEVVGDTVTLSGHVTRPTLKSDAAAVVQRVPGVAVVVNNVEVLPVSPADNHIRRAAYRTLFNYNSPLFRYGLGGDPAIHILVENGHVTLKGFVSSEMHKQIATTYMRHLFGVFSVTNDLVVG